MTFRYPSHRIGEIVRAPKLVREGQALVFKSYKEYGKELAVDLDLEEGALVNLRFVITAGRFDDPETYRAALLLEGERIRGVDYSLLETKRFYKTAIPQGWHQNVVDPNLPTRESNRHQPLPGFEITDLTNFLRKAAELWHIELALEDALL